MFALKMNWVPLASRHCFFLLVTVALVALAPPRSSAADSAFSDQIKPFLATYCLSCHGETKQSGGLDLHDYTDAKAVVKDRDVWENVVQRIQNGEMPPKKKPQPFPAESFDDQPGLPVSPEEQARFDAASNDLVDLAQPSAPEGSDTLHLAKPMLRMIDRVETEHEVKEAMSA